MLLICVSLSACLQERKSYPFELRDCVENVTKIEILGYTLAEDSKTHLADIPQESFADFYADVKALDCYATYAISSVGWGPVIIRISYTNGEWDELGIHLIAWYSASGRYYAQWCVLDQKQFCQLLLKYVDASVLPDLSAYLK